MKKIIFSVFIILVYYFFFNSLIFFFSYLSMINGKVYKLNFINVIQKSIYFKGGFRSIWQNKKECVKFDQYLLYVPKIGNCSFDNIEFKTNLNFDKYNRIHKSFLDTNKDENGIAVLGDSYAMGWGVNDNQTYSSILEKKINRKVFNQGVSSYGTIRQVKKFINSDIKDKTKKIIIHYNLNDLSENNNLDINKVYDKESSNLIFKNKKIDFFWILRQWKRSFRLIFNEIKKTIINNKSDIVIVDLNKHFSKVESILKKNSIFNNKKIIILFIKEPKMTVVDNLKKSPNKNIEYLILDLNKDNFFIVDDHLNVLGHQTIAELIADKL